MAKPGREEPWVPLARGFLPPKEEASEGHGTGPPDSALREAKPPVPSPAMGAPACPSGCRVHLSVGPPGAPQAEQHEGPRDTEREGDGTAGPGRSGVGGKGAGSLPSSSARRRSSSARLGLLYYCFQP